MTELGRRFARELNEAPLRRHLSVRGAGVPPATMQGWCRYLPGVEVTDPC